MSHVAKDNVPEGGVEDVYYSGAAFCLRIYVDNVGTARTTFVARSGSLSTLQVSVVRKTR